MIEAWQIKAVVMVVDYVVMVVDYNCPFYILQLFI
jgi:hypothetical protein